MTDGEQRAATMQHRDVAEERADHALFVALGCRCEAHCRVCGCGDLHACEGGCIWVEDPLDVGPVCSNCLPIVIAAIEQLQMDLAVLESLELIERVVPEDGSDVGWAPTRYRQLRGGETRR